MKFEHKQGWQFLNKLSSFNFKPISQHNGFEVRKKCIQIGAPELVYDIVYTHVCLCTS